MDQRRRVSPERAGLCRDRQAVRGRLPPNQLGPASMARDRAAVPTCPAIVAAPAAAAVPMRIVKTIPITCPTMPPTLGGNTKAPGGGVAKAPGGGVAKNSGGGVGMNTSGAGVGPKLKENDPPPDDTGPAQAAAASWKRCSAPETKGSSTTKAHPASTPTSKPASVGSGAEAPARAVLNPAAAAIARKMTNAPRLNSGTSNPTRQRSAGDTQVTARLAASVPPNATIPAISPYRSQGGASVPTRREASADIPSPNLPAA